MHLNLIRAICEICGQLHQTASSKSKATRNRSCSHNNNGCPEWRLAGAARLFVQDLHFHVLEQPAGVVSGDFNVPRLQALCLMPDDCSAVDQDIRLVANGYYFELEKVVLEINHGGGV